MRGLILGFVVFITSAAFAGEYQRFDDLSQKKQAAWAIPALATIPLHIENGFRCTAVVIGPGGEALTNLHCVESCLNAQQVASPEDIPDLPLKKMRVDMSRLPITCRASTATSAPITVNDFEVLHIFGPGWISDRNVMNQLMDFDPQKFLELTADGTESRGDLVLIRLKLDKPTCVKLGDVDFSAPTPVPVTSLAYPVIAREDHSQGYFPVTFLTMGFTLVYSSGEATANRETLAQKVLPQYVSGIDVMAQPQLIVGSVDTEGGASGSGLFDDNQSLVAITRSTWKGPVTVYVPWTDGAIDLKPYMPWLRDNVPNLDQCK